MQQEGKLTEGWVVLSESPSLVRNKFACATGREANRYPKLPPRSISHSHRSVLEGPDQSHQDGKGIDTRRRHKTVHKGPGLGFRVQGVQGLRVQGPK